MSGNYTARPDAIKSKIPETKVSGIFCQMCNQLAYDDDVCGLKTFGALFNSELDLLAFLQVLETFALDGGEMDEDIRAAFALEKAVAFRSIEPFDCTVDTFRHVCLLVASEKFLEGTHWVLHRSRLNGGSANQPTDEPRADLVLPKQTTGILRPQG
jgi:hypothetical protein